MAVKERESFDYINTSTDLKDGHGLKGTSTEGQCDLATISTDIPLGISQEDVAKAPAAAGPFGAATVAVTPKQCKAVAAGAVAINVLITATTGGKFTTAVKALDSATAEFAWGRTISAVANADELLSVVFNWFEMQIA